MAGTGRFGAVVVGGAVATSGAVVLASPVLVSASPSGTLGGVSFSVLRTLGTSPVSSNIPLSLFVAPSKMVANR